MAPSVHEIIITIFLGNKANLFGHLASLHIHNLLQHCHDTFDDNALPDVDIMIEAIAVPGTYREAMLAS
jgi:hypothetical protein